MDDRPDCGYCKVCTKRWAPAGLGSVLDIISALRRLTGRPNASVPPGPGYCGRFACIGAAQAWFCNDNDEEITLDSWEVFARAVEDIMRQCWWREKEGLHLTDLTGGQIFRPDGWNVIVLGGDDVCKS
ncbi:hypothetical protein KVR01_012166 [Diaporthe batatas]|uniref:uncharacterized protein n=1 Tax=Diaporthe batatas TaxID=748121 RepID=UPI001D0547F9|nr:uncharacterized protein KVR01_012166 [Diaporthe batatas]KAG8157894.1 hypothetical protein KVR01_012166 [Diaporthe batatas]